MKTLHRKLNADLYVPRATRSVRRAQLVYARLYHSVSLLLPDATVWVAAEPSARHLRQPHEVYTPQYLLNADGTPATRPAISALLRRDRLWRGVSGADFPMRHISNVVLMRNGAVTHAFDMTSATLDFLHPGAAATCSARSPTSASAADRSIISVVLVEGLPPPMIITFGV